MNRNNVLILVTVALLLLLLPSQCSAEFPFRNTSLPWPIRVQDLVHRLTPYELVQQLSKGGIGPVGGPTPAIPRLNIQPYQWATECLRGDVQAGSATSFPQAVGLAATFDAELVAAVAYATALEVRAKHNDHVRIGDFSYHTGLSCFAPVINIMRHPFWGRNQETYGEDPFLAATLAEAFVRSLQGQRPKMYKGGEAEEELRTSRYLLASAGCKHFAAYNGPEIFPINRFAFDAKVSEQDLQLTFLPQFQRCVEAGSRSIMCSYNSVNGVPACANHRLLTEVLRNQWKFDGYVVSDAGALEFAIIFHKFFNNRLEAAVGSFRAGVNLDLSACPYESCVVFNHLTEALNKSLVTLEELRAAATPLFLTRMALGEFDPVEMNPYANLTASHFVQSQQHRKLSLQAAQASIVLLKNLDNFLPDGLLPDTKIGVSGPLSDQMSLVYGDYSPTRMPEFETRLLDTLGHHFKTVQHQVFCQDGVTCTRRNAGAIDQLLKMDVVILALGTSTHIETEGLDRLSLELPDGQQQLLRTVAAANKTIILLIVSGAPVVLDFAETSTAVKAILWCGYPAQFFGAAVASVLVGKVSPYSALPFTWYSGDNPLSDMTNYDLHNQTYRYANLSDPAAVPLYHFGHGLSYCQFELSNLTLASQRISSVQNLSLEFRVANRGKRQCQLVAKAFVAKATEDSSNPRRWLAAIAKLQVPQFSNSTIAKLQIVPRDLRLWDNRTATTRVLPGNYSVVVGNYYDKKCQYCRLQAQFSVVG